MHTDRTVASSLGAALVAASLFVTSTAAANPPEHLVWAEELVTNVAPALNMYATGPSYVTWAGADGATQYENRSLCTSFVTIVLKQAYDWTDADFGAWFGSSSPNAATYHDVIEDEIGFSRVLTIGEIVAGDFIAIRYPEGSSVTGHMATARGPATLRATATPPFVTGTVQYELPIVDSSSTGHGPTDTRLLPNGQWHAGVGFGVMRLYTNGAGVIVGHTWSTNAGIYYGQSTRHAVVGRLL